MTIFTRLGLIAILPFLLSPSQIAIAGPASPSQTTIAQSTPKAVLDQFYTAYTTRNQTWKDLKDLIDPATYDYLSRVRPDAEPFTNVQVDIWSYTIGTPRIRGNQAEVPVTVMAGLRRGESPVNLRLVLRKNGNRWQIRNVLYSAKPKDDLLNMWKP